MKKFMIMLLAAVGVLFFAGCSDSPKDVAEKWANAIIEGDAETANKYSTSGVHLLNGMMIATVKEGGEEAANFKSNFSKINDAEEKIDGDNAKVILGPEQSVDLKKVDGEWKVHVEK